jgi:ribosome assembly protein YihI (activator of Der GTPase)
MAKTVLSGFFATLLLVSGATAQDTLTFSGPYRAGSLVGEADFDYTLRRSDTLRNGNFRMQGASARALLDGTDSTFSLAGRFQRNVPIGDWTLQFGTYQVDGPPIVENHRYQLRTRGRAHTAYGTIARGKLDGSWQHREVTIADSEPVDTVFRSEITFVNGVPQQAFRLEGEENVLLGRFKRDGLAHDTWTLYADMLTSENWHFVDGRLDRIETIGEQGTATTPVLPNNLSRTTLVNLDARYFRLLERWQLTQGRETPFAGSMATELLARNASRYQRVVEVLEELGGAELMPLFSVVVPDLPLSRQEVASLDSIASTLSLIDTIRRSLESNMTFAVLETADPEVAALRVRLGQVTGSNLDPVRELSEVAEDDILRFLPRPALLADLYPEAAPADLSAVAVQTRETLEQVLAIRTALNEKLNTEERQRVLTALDEQLMYEFGVLDSLITDREATVPADYALSEVREAARRQLSLYAGMDDIVAKRERARELIDCMVDYDALTLTLAAQPERRREIEALYTDQVWNNFTATVMEERIKRRITEAYTEIALPYLIGQVSPTLSCEETDRLNRQFDTLHTRMTELRTAETDDLEDQLKGTEDPRAVLNLLRLPLQQ